MADRSPENNAEDSNKSRADERVHKSMNWILTSHQVVGGLAIGDHLRQTENREAEMSWNRGLKGNSWPDVIRCERHCARRSRALV